MDTVIWRQEGLRRGDAEGDRDQRPQGERDRERGLEGKRGEAGAPRPGEEGGERSMDKDTRLATGSEAGEGRGKASGGDWGGRTAVPGAIFGGPKSRAATLPRAGKRRRARVAAFGVRMDKEEAAQGADGASPNGGIRGGRQKKPR